MSARPALTRSLALLPLLLGLQVAHADQERGPRRLIEALGVEIRAALENTKGGRTPEDTERAVAEQIAALVRNEPGHLSLTAPDSRGRTPLMLAVSGSYARVVDALLADPGVKLAINTPDRSGETAWMTAHLVPSMTLAACEPGVLTLERAQLLPPYLRRMQHLLRTDAADIVAIVRALEAAGAEPKPEDARRIWLARCSNASPELREAIASGAPLPTRLVSEAIKRLSEFTANARKDPDSVAAKPPEGMRFVGSANKEPVTPLGELLRVNSVRCVHMAKPMVPRLGLWSGEMMFKVTVSTRAGVVEAADFDVLTSRPDKRVADALRHAILGALADYRCEGDQVFQQEFKFKYG